MIYFRLIAITVFLMTVVGVIGGIYGKGYLDAKHAAERKADQARIELLVRQKELVEQAHKQDAEKLAAAEKELADYDVLVEDLEHALEDPDRACLDPADVERLRKLFGEAQPR